MIQSLATLRYERETVNYCSNLVTYFCISSGIDSYTLVGMLGYTDQKNSEYGHFLRSDMYDFNFNFFEMECFPKRVVTLHKPSFGEIEE